MSPAVLLGEVAVLLGLDVTVVGEHANNFKELDLAGELSELILGRTRESINLLDSTDELFSKALSSWKMV